MRCHDDRIDSTNDYLRDNYCIDAVAAYDDDHDVFQYAFVWLYYGYCGVLVDGVASVYCAGVESVAMANYVHCGVNVKNVAYPLDGDGDAAHDLVMLQATLAEYVLQIEPF